MKHLLLLILAFGFFGEAIGDPPKRPAWQLRQDPDYCHHFNISTKTATNIPSRINLAKTLLAKLEWEDIEPYYGTLILFAASDEYLFYLTNAHVLPHNKSKWSKLFAYSPIKSYQKSKIEVLSFSKGYDIAVLILKKEKTDKHSKDELNTIINSMFDKRIFSGTEKHIALYGTPGFVNDLTPSLKNMVWEEEADLRSRWHDEIPMTYLPESLNRLSVKKVPLKWNRECPAVFLNGCYSVPIRSWGYSGGALLISDDLKNEGISIGGIVSHYSPLSEWTYVIPISTARSIAHKTLLKSFQFDSQASLGLFDPLGRPILTYPLKHNENITTDFSYITDGAVKILKGPLAEKIIRRVSLPESDSGSDIWKAGGGESVGGGGGGESAGGGGESAGGGGESAGGGGESAGGGGESAGGGGESAGGGGESAGGGGESAGGGGESAGGGGKSTHGGGGKSTHGGGGKSTHGGGEGAGGGGESSGGSSTIKSIHKQNGYIILDRFGNLSGLVNYDRLINELLHPKSWHLRSSILGRIISQSPQFKGSDTLLRYYPGVMIGDEGPYYYINGRPIIGIQTVLSSYYDLKTPELKTTFEAKPIPDLLTLNQNTTHRYGMHSRTTINKYTDIKTINSLREKYPEKAYYQISPHDNFFLSLKRFEMFPFIRANKSAEDVLSVRRNWHGSSSLTSGMIRKTPDGEIEIQMLAPRFGTFSIALHGDFEQEGPYYYHYRGMISYTKPVIFPELKEIPVKQDVHGVVTLQYNPQELIYELKIILAYEADKNSDHQNNFYAKNNRILLEGFYLPLKESTVEPIVILGEDQWDHLESWNKSIHEIFEKDFEKLVSAWIDIEERNQYITTFKEEYASTMQKMADQYNCPHLQVLAIMAGSRYVYISDILKYALETYLPKKS